jgi:TonB family protein
MKSSARLALFCVVILPALARSESLKEPPAVRSVVHARMDPKRPFLLGDDYYPSASKLAGEVGSCAAAAYVDAEGWIMAVQVVTSTGFPRLDAACIRAFDNGRVIPGSVNGVPTAAWEVFRLTWALTSGKTPAIIPLPADGSTPRMRTDYAPHVGDQYYPAEARAKHQQGSCLVVAKIGADGEARDPAVVKSTGSASLDHACLGAVTLASFTPQTRNGAAVDAPIEISLYWRLK